MEEELEAMHSDAEVGRVWRLGARNGLFPVEAPGVGTWPLVPAPGLVRVHLRVDVRGVLVCRALDEPTQLDVLPSSARG